MGHVRMFSPGRKTSITTAIKLETLQENGRVPPARWFVNH